jgi:transcriptional regulator with XRE-family HTH domain
MHTNRGQQVLVNSGLALSTIAELTECSRQAVHSWTSGRSKPDPEKRKRLASIVPPSAWDRAPRESDELEDDEPLELADDFLLHSVPIARAHILAAERLRARLVREGRTDLLPPESPGDA